MRDFSKVTFIRNTILSAVICASSALSVHAAESTDSLGGYEVEAMASVSSPSGHTPFWFITNRAGLGSTKPNTGYVRAAAHLKGEISKYWSWRGGADLVGAWRAEAPFMIRELYGAIKYRPFELLVGSKIEDNSLVDKNLSSGDLLFSGNSLPIPQVKVSIPEYLSVPFLNNWLAFKAYASVGMFTDADWQADFVRPSARSYKDVLYHTKGLHLKVGRPDRFPLIFEGHFDMASQFGGKIMLGGEVYKKMPSSFGDFFKHIFIPTGGGGPDFPGEQSNVLGNHVGQWSARLTYAPQNSDIRVSAYYLHYFEDHSMMFFDYVWRDGLYGLDITLPKNPFISKLVYEYLSTKDQSGPVYWDHTPDIPEQVSGCDNYYNHSLYGGWFHWGQGIGNPLVVSPIWNVDHGLRFACNRVVAHHIGATGDPLSWLRWRVLASYTRGWGTYGSPYVDVKRSLNLLGEITYTPQQLNGWSATFSVGYDRGGIIGESKGLMLSIKKTGIL